MEERYTEKSVIDMIMSSDKRAFADVKSLPTVSLDSDHRMVLGKLKLQISRKHRKITKERFCVERLREDYVGAEFNEKIKREEERSKEGVEWRRAGRLLREEWGKCLEK